jgi:hypothetical protein
MTPTPIIVYLLGYKPNFSLFDLTQLGLAFCTFDPGEGLGAEASA